MRSIFFALFFGILAYIIYIWMQRFAEWNRNNHMPREAVRAQLLKKEKRADTAMMPVGADGAMMPMDNTTYHLFFRTADGEERKYSVSAKIYRNVTEGSNGTLAFQGTRFLDFEADN